MRARRTEVLRGLRDARCARIALWIALLVAAFGCVDGDAGRGVARDPSAPAEPNKGAGIAALAIEERLASVDAQLSAAHAQLDQGQSPALARAAAAQAVELVRLGGPARYLVRARELLDRGARARGADACNCALDHSRLLASLGHELDAAYAIAARAAQMHAPDSSSAECVRDLERAARTLREHASADAMLDVRPLPFAGDGLHDDAVADWASTQQRAAAVTLDEIAIYGRTTDGVKGERAAEARVVLRFDGVAVYRRSELPQAQGWPRRLLLDLDGVRVAPSVSRAIDVDAGGLARVRIGSEEDVTEGAQARVTFEVAPDAAYRLFFLSDPYRIVMDFREQARGAPVVKGAYTIVLDPGHGGVQTGAKGPSGIRESEVALSLALRTRRLLTRALPMARIVMTRERDVDVSLEARAALANALDADLFVSIHLNASPSADDKGGVATYVLDSTDDAAALRLAAQENGTDAAGVSALQLVLASLYRKDQVDRSLALAHDVQSALLRSGRTVHAELNDRGVKRALFYVLVGARMPAVLVEASFITRPEEAELLTTDRYRQALAEGIAQGVERYVRRALETRRGRTQ